MKSTKSYGEKQTDRYDSIKYEVRKYKNEMQKARLLKHAPNRTGWKNGWYLVFPTVQLPRDDTADK
jgi:hypothetical protein